jgi:carboxypeptidase C (cathepsin A)
MVTASLASQRDNEEQARVGRPANYLKGSAATTGYRFRSTEAISSAAWPNGYRTDLQYRLLNREISGHWDFGTTATRQGFAGSLDELQRARIQNPSLGVLIVHGFTDLVIPYSISRYLIDQIPPIESARPIEFRVYRGGHMMYLRPDSRTALRADARGFYGKVLGPP